MKDLREIGAAALPKAGGALLLAASLLGAWQTWLIARARRRGRHLVRQARAVDVRPRVAAARVLLVGDSTGVGVGAACADDSLPGLLARAYPGVEIHNLCCNGARVADAAEQAQCRAGARFDLALVLVGGNDVLALTPASRLAAQADALLQQLQRCARRVVWMGSANIGNAPVLRPPLAWLASWRTRRTMRLLAGVARRRHVPFIDFWRRRRDDPFVAPAEIYYAADGMHPSSASYRLCFEVLRRRLPLDRWLATTRC